MTTRVTALQLLSLVVPARDEEECVVGTLTELHAELSRHGIPHEIVVVDDGSSDQTWRLLQELAQTNPVVKPVRNSGSHGFGRAVVCGLDHMQGDAVVITMADGSDHPQDVVRYWQELNQGVDCVFGSRFVRGGTVVDYPRLKLVINRLANLFLQVIFFTRLNDTTNAFKAYRREVIDGCRPFVSPHFNLTVEIPLKAMVRGYSWVVIPIGWRNRRGGASKLKLKEMGSRYLFTCLYAWLERMLTRDDFKKGHRL